MDRLRKIAEAMGAGDRGGISEGDDEDEDDDDDDDDVPDLVENFEEAAAK
jgi:nascent polypeptide-associated complex subunit beta